MNLPRLLQRKGYGPAASSNCAKTNKGMVNTMYTLASYHQP